MRRTILWILGIIVVVALHWGADVVSDGKQGRPGPATASGAVAH